MSRLPTVPCTGWMGRAEWFEPDDGPLGSPRQSAPGRPRPPVVAPPEHRLMPQNAVLELQRIGGVRCGDTVLLPAGYEGWVVASYNVTGAPTLGRDGCKVLIRIPESGRISTSSHRASGYGIDRFYYLSAQEKRMRLPIEADGCGDQTCVQAFQYYSDANQTAIFSVGPQSKIDEYPRPKVEVRRSG